jgi:hypothetical protein
LLGTAEAGAVEGAEAGGVFGGIPGGLIGAGIGGAAAETATSLMFRNREAPQAQSSFLDARTLNNQSQTVRPMQPRFQRHEGFDSREERSSGSSQTPQYFNIASRSQSRDVLRPSAAPILQPMSERGAQSVIDETAEAPGRGERVRFTRNRAPPSQAIEGEANPGMMDRAPKESYKDIMQATAAPTAPRNRKRPGENSGSPYAYPISGAPPLPARPSSSRDPAPNRRNKGPPRDKKKDVDKSKR